MPSSASQSPFIYHNLELQSKKRHNSNLISIPHVNGLHLKPSPLSHIYVIYSLRAFSALAGPFLEAWALLFLLSNHCGQVNAKAA